MKYPDVASRVRELMTGEPDSIRGDWHHYPCFMCDDVHGHGARMGINVVTGAVHCLRCGFHTRVFIGGAGALIAPPDRKGDLDEWDYTSFPEQTEHDRRAALTMSMRGFGQDTSDVGGWMYGRGKALGYPVFPCVSSTGVLLYAQMKNLNGRKPKYLATKTQPRLDFNTPMTTAISRRVLVLVEGPMDMVNVRVSTPMVWCCYNSGTGIKRSIINDIVNYRKHMNFPQRVVIMFDAEEMAYTASVEFANVLNMAHGIPTSAVRWPQESMLVGSDPGNSHPDLIRRLLAQHM